MKQLLIGIFIAISPTFFTIYYNSKSELKSKVDRHEITLENHRLRVELLEKNSSSIERKLDDIVSGIHSIDLQLKDKKDK